MVLIAIISLLSDGYFWSLLSKIEPVFFTLGDYLIAAGGIIKLRDGGGLKWKECLIFLRIIIADTDGVTAI